MTEVFVDNPSRETRVLPVSPLKANSRYGKKTRGTGGAEAKALELYPDTLAHRGQNSVPKQKGEPTRANFPGKIQMRAQISATWYSKVYPDLKSHIPGKQRHKTTPRITPRTGQDHQ